MLFLACGLPTLLQSTLANQTHVKKGELANPCGRRLMQVLLTILAEKKFHFAICREHVLEKIMLLHGVPPPWHEDQLHLAEWQAHSTREILFNLDMSVEARNSAKKKAMHHRNLVV